MLKGFHRHQTTKQKWPPGGEAPNQNLNTSTPGAVCKPWQVNYEQTINDPEQAPPGLCLEEL